MSVVLDKCQPSYNVEHTNVLILPNCQNNILQPIEDIFNLINDDQGLIKCICKIMIIKNYDKLQPIYHSRYI